MIIHVWDTTHIPCRSHKLDFDRTKINYSYKSICVKFVFSLCFLNYFTLQVNLGIICVCIEEMKYICFIPQGPCRISHRTSTVWSVNLCALIRTRW